MKLRLKEQPNEWRKFTAVMTFACGVMAALLHTRKILSRELLIAVWSGLGVILLASLLAPRWFKGFYRVGMTASFHIGQVMGKVILTIFFLVLLTPLGLLLRLLGQDLLRLKPDKTATTYWRPAKTNRQFDRLF